MTSSDTHPFVSVVLPTRDRSELLRDCLVNGLFHQTYPADRWEIILINDGSVDDTEAVVQALTPQSPVPLRYFKLSGRGAAVARNFGTQQARGEIVAHIDDDGRAVPEWLVEGVRAFKPGIAIVTGPIIPDPSQPIPFFSFVSESDRDRGIYPTSNIFYQREAFLEIGGFSEAFGVNVLGRPAYGWDTDLAWRLRRKGYGAAFAPGAVTYSHVFRLSPRQWLYEPWRAYLLPTVIRHAPEATRGIFTAYPFFDAFHRLWVLGMLGLLATPWTAWALLLMLPWTVRVVRDLQHDIIHPWRWPIASVKAAFLWLRQGILLVSLLYGSVRARRLVI